MASPVDAGRATTNSTTSGTSHSLNLPASIGSGDILIGIVRAPASTTISWPAGWTEQEQSNADASDDETSIAYRLADGTEGATITITLGTSRILVGYVVRITGASGLSGITRSASVVGSATQPDSPNHAAQTSVNKDFLAVSIGGCDDSETLSSGPASYSNATVQGSTATGTGGCTVFGATREITGATAENPGAWTLGSTSIWTAWTILVSDAPWPVRASQVPVEAAIEPTSQRARISQIPVEATIDLGGQKARISQVPVEALIFVTPVVAPSFQVFIID